MRAIFTFVTGRRTAWVTLVACIIGVALALALLPRATSTTATTTLPASADSQQVAKLLATFPNPDSEYGLVVWSRHDGARLTSADNAAIRSRIPALAALTPRPNLVRETLAVNRTAILVDLPIADSAGHGSTVTADRILRTASEGLPSDLRAQLTGTVAAPASEATSSGGLDVALLVISVLAALVLLLVSRRLVLWLAQLVALGTAGWVALRVAEATYAGLRAPLSADARDIIFGIVVGLGAVYCIVLVVRYRAERRATADSNTADASTALRSALATTGIPIGASAILIGLGMLTVLIATVPATRAAGISVAVDVVILAILVLILLPALFTVTGRALLWPSVAASTPASATSTPPSSVRSLLFAVAAAAVVCLVALSLIDAAASAAASSTATTTAQRDAQKTIDAAYGTGYGNQAIMLSPAYFAGETSTVAPTTLAMNFDTVHAVTRDATSHGRTELIVALDADPGSPKALATIRELRASIATTGGLTAHTLVGGTDAAQLDQRAAASADGTAFLLIGIGGLVLLVLATAGLIVSVRRANRATSRN